MKNNSSNSIKLSDYIEYKISIQLITYGFPWIIIAGTIGNILSFIVLLRPRLRNHSFYTYLACLAITDTFVLYSSAFKTWMRSVTGFEILHNSAIGCKVFMFILLSSMHLSSWFLVLLTFDRLYAVWRPLRAGRVFNVRRGRLITSATIALCFLYNSHVFWTYKLENRKSTYHCVSTDEYRFFMKKIFPYLKMVTYSFLPFGLVLIMNIMIISSLLKRTAKFSDSLTGRQTSAVAGQYKVITLLLTVSFTWLFLTAPFSIWSVIGLYRGTGDIRQKADQLIPKTIVFALMYLNHAINFYIYW